MRTVQKIRSFSTAGLICIVAFVVSNCSRYTAIDTYLIRTVTVNGQARSYRVRLPDGWDSNVKMPVMLYLHGSGSRGHDNREQAWAFQGATEFVSDQIKFIVVLPQCKDEMFWSATEMSDHALAALAATVNEFNGDPDRLYLAGFSLGGYGTWQIAAGNPGKFAALMPVAGGVVGNQPIDPRDRAAIIPSVGVMLDSPDPYGALANAIGQTPVWVFQGAKDDAVPVDFARKIVKALQQAGNRNVKYTEYPDEGHMIFGKAFAEPGLFEWLAAQRIVK